jgi:hypothetical protein
MYNIIPCNIFWVHNLFNLKVDFENHDLKHILHNSLLLMTYSLVQVTHINQIAPFIHFEQHGF